MFALILYLLLQLLFIALAAAAIYFIYKPSIIYFRDNYSSNPNGSLKQVVMEAMDFPYKEYKKAYRNGTPFNGKIITAEDRRKMFLTIRLAKQKKSLGWAMAIVFMIFGVLFGSRPSSEVNVTMASAQAALDAQGGAAPRSNDSAYMNAYMMNMNNE